jgi:hypothetical protein
MIEDTAIRAKSLLKLIRDVDDRKHMPTLALSQTYAVTHR